MATTTLTTPDLDVGEQVEIALVPGPQLTKLRIFAVNTVPGGVSAVTGVDPITSTGGATPAIAILPATEADAGSMSAADKTKLDAIASTDLWPFDIPIPAAAVAPELAQAQATVGAGQPITMRSQAAATGSGLEGGPIFFTIGKSEDGLVSGTVLFGSESVVGGSVPPTTNYFGALDLTWHETSGVVIANFGRGTNGTGAGVAAVEISAFSEINIATEGNNSIINLQPASSFGGQSFFSHAQSQVDGTPALSISSSPSDPVASQGVLRLAWDTSSSLMGILEQRDVANANDLDLVSRHLIELYYGNYLENNRYHARTAVLFELFAAGGNGWDYSSPTGHAFNVSTDNLKTLRQGCAGNNEDGFIRQVQTADLATTALTPIAEVDMTQSSGGSGFTAAVQQLRVHVVGIDNVTGEWASFDLVSCFKLAGGVVTGPTVAGIPSDTGHSAGGIPSSPLQFAISGTHVNVEVGPFAATASHWTINIERVVNAGTL